MRLLFLLSLMVTLVAAFFAAMESRTLWSLTEETKNVYQKKADIADYKQQLNSHPFTTVEKISQFSESGFFERAIPNWQSSRSYHLFNQITLPENDNGQSLSAWLAETRLYINAQERHIDQKIEQALSKNKESLFATFCAYMLLVAMTWSSTYIWHRLRMNVLLNKLVESNLYLKKKQADLTKANAIMGSILEDLNAEKKRSSFAKINDQRLTLVAKYSDDGLIGLDENGDISSWNPKAEALFSKPESTMLEKPFNVLFDDIDNHKICNAIRTLSAQAPHKSITVKWLSTESPTVHYLEVSITGLFSDNTIVGYSVIVRDVSNRIREIEQLKLLIEATPNAIIMSNEAGQIIQVNGHAEKSFGYTKHEMLALKIEDLLPSELAKNHQQLRHSYLQNPKIRRMGTNLALQARRKDGSFIFVEVGLAPVRLNDQWYVISAITDISERIEAQKKLTEFNHSLTRKNREMEQFVYTVSHDLKAPLVTIAAFSRSVKKILGDSCDERVIHKVDRVIANAAKMEDLITDLLEISRVMNRPLTLEAFSLDGAVKDVAESLEEDLRACTVTTDVNPELIIKASRPQIIQCLQNIIGNAAKYKRDETTATIHISAVAKNHNIIIRIKDNGTGIDKSLHERIFDIFERGDVDQPGTGVGLAIVKSIIEKHGGTITLESAVGVGSTFTLTLPQMDIHNNDEI
ncbi:MAG TPA: PAS domain S-box protein [Marinagarivorans sp.]